MSSPYPQGGDYAGSKYQEMGLIVGPVGRCIPRGSGLQSKENGGSDSKLG